MSFLAFLKKSLRKLDLMTDVPNLKIEGKRAYQTSIGGLVNIVLIF